MNKRITWLRNKGENVTSMWSMTVDHGHYTFIVKIEIHIFRSYNNSEMSCLKPSAVLSTSMEGLLLEFKDWLIMHESIQP